MLLERPGLFLDADVILLPGFSPAQYDPQRLTMYGHALEFGYHATGFFGAPTSGNPVLAEWLARAKAKIAYHRRLPRALRWKLRRVLRGKPAKVPWNYIGNAILDPLLRERDFSAHIDLRDMDARGFYMIDGMVGDPDITSAYLRFWFSEARPVNEVLERARDKVLFLQNSWHDPAYKALGTDEVLAHPSLLSRVLRSALGAEA